MNREALDRWCERGILALVLAVLVFGPLAMGAVRTLPFLIIQGLTVGVMLLWGARFWLNGRPQLLWPPICWGVVAFLVYAVGRYFTSDIEYVARQELIHVLVYACLFFAILNNLYRQESVVVITCTLLGLAMAISSYAIYQVVTHTHWVWNIRVPGKFTGSGTYVSGNHLAGFLELLLPLGLAYTLTSRLKPVTRVLVGYASLVILAGISVTVSRGAYVSTAVALLLFFGVLLFNRRYRLPSLVLLALLVWAGFYFLPRNYGVEARIKPLFKGSWERIEDDSRVAMWQSALRLWRENVWWGVGPAHYDVRFRQYRPLSVQLRPGWAHNDYLNLLAEWGVVGTALVAGAWVLLGVGVIKTWPAVRAAPQDLGKERGSNRFAFVLGAALGLAAILIHSAVDFNMHIPANAILAVGLMALLSSQLRFATERYWVTLKVWGKVLASVAVLAAVVYLGRQGWHHAREYVWLQRAADAPSYSPGQAACLQKAFDAEPMNAETAYAIGQAYRMQSSEGADNYRELAKEAMGWFGRSIKLNPWGGYAYLRYGWCLYWLGQTAESASYFNRAEELEPTGYFMAANIGVHYADTGDYAAAKLWFERSLHLEWQDNDIARNYLQIVKARMLEAGTNEISAKLNIPVQ